DRLLDLLAELRLDALIVPANSVAWRTDYAEGDRFMVSSSSIAAVSGFPALALPIALERGLPLGVSLVAAPGNEGVLFSLAAAIEARRGPFPEPRFLPETPGL